MRLLVSNQEQQQKAGCGNNSWHIALAGAEPSRGLKMTPAREREISLILEFSHARCMAHMM